MWRGAPSARCGALAHMPAAVASLNPVWHAALPRLTRGAATTPTRRSSAASSSHVVGQSTTLTSSSGRFLGSSGALLAQMQRQRGQRRTVQLRSVGLPVLAMVNVELSPATYLGVVLIGSGLTLLQIRQSKPVLSRDTDIISACISILAGGILIFQGWRLDPILLFEQLLMASCAIAFGYEALKLRSELPPDQQQPGQGGPLGLPPVLPNDAYAKAQQRGRLPPLPPPGEATRPGYYGSWVGMDAGGQQQQQQPEVLPAQPMVPGMQQQQQGGWGQGMQVMGEQAPWDRQVGPTRIASYQGYEEQQQRYGDGYGGGDQDMASPSGRGQQQPGEYSGQYYSGPGQYYGQVPPPTGQYYQQQPGPSQPYPPAGPSNFVQQPDGTFRPVGDGYDFNAPPASPGGLVGQVSPAAGNGQETGQGAVRGGSPADQQQQGQRSAGPGQRGGRGFRGNGQSYGVEDWE